MRWNGEKRREKRRGCWWPPVISYCSIQESGEDGRDGSIPHCRRFRLIGKCFPLHGAAEVGKEMKKRRWDAELGHFVMDVGTELWWGLAVGISWDRMG